MSTQIRGDVDIKSGTIVNAQIAAAAAIAYSKLNLTGSIVNADIVSLAWSKLTGTPTTLAGYGITSPLPVAQGGTGTATAIADGAVVYAAGGAGAYKGDATKLFVDDATGDVSLGGVVGKYKNVNTAGWGLPAIYAAGRPAAGQTAAVASVATYTVGAADGSFLVSANVNVTISTTHSFSVQLDYTDETNTARTLTLTLSKLDGTLLSVITDATGAGPYAGLTFQIRCKASTTITIKTSGTFTTVTYNVEGLIQQVR